MTLNDMNPELRDDASVGACIGLLELDSVATRQVCASVARRLTQDGPRDAQLHSGTRAASKARAHARSS